MYGVVSCVGLCYFLTFNTMCCTALYLQLGTGTPGGSMTSDDVDGNAGGADDAAKLKRDHLLKKIMRITDEIEEEQAKKGGQ